MRGTNPAYKRELIRKFELQIIRRIPCEKPARMRKYMLTFAWFKVQVGLILLQGETTQQYSLNFISRSVNNNAFRSSAVSKEPGERNTIQIKSFRVDWEKREILCYISLKPYTSLKKFIKCLRLQFTQYGTPFHKRLYEEKI